ncbi:MAG: porin [Casimicrobium sp.]
MQKTLLALALLGTTSAVMAQTTIYGVVDSMYSYGKSEKNSLSALGSGGNMTSRFGFRGTENLGSGYRVEYNLESQVFVDSGAGQGTNANNQASGATTATMSFARRSTISLFGPMGELRAGRDFTSHYRNRVEVDPFGNAGVGASQAFAGSIGGVVSTRVSNMLGYYLPGNLGGAYGQAQYYMGENTSGAANSRDGTGVSARLGYEYGPVNISVASGRTSYATTATLGNITSNNLGVRYKIGDVTLMGGLYRDTVSATKPVHAKGWIAAGQWSPGAHQLKLALSQYGTDALGTPKVRKVAAGYVYNLSKRTALYTTAAHLSNSGGAAAVLNGATAVANATSRGLDIGIRHLF